MKKTPKFKTVPIEGKQNVSIMEQQEQDCTREAKLGTKGSCSTDWMMAWLTSVQSCRMEAGSGLGSNSFHWQFSQHQRNAKCLRSIWEVKWTSQDEQGTEQEADLLTLCQARTVVNTYMVFLGQGF